jgi:RNA polymerase sigma factor for flagellar operon FliA
MPTTAEERQRLVDGNIPFVRSIAAKIKEQLPREIEFDDLVSYGMQGLLEAAERYDARHGTAFTTFAYYRIRGAIFDGLRGMGWLPRGEYARLRSEERANAYLGNACDRDAGEARTSDGEAPLLEDEVRSIADALGGVAAIFVTTLDAARGQLAGVSAATPLADELIEGLERSHAVRAALETLPAKERRLLELYYYQDRSLNDAGQAMGLSKSWASRLHARAITLLTEALERQAGTAGDPGLKDGEAGGGGRAPPKKRRASRNA